MAARVQSSRPLMAALLAAAMLGLAMRCLAPEPADEQAFVAGVSAPLALRGSAVRRWSPVMRYAASEDTFLKVADVIADQLGIDKEKVTRTATLTELGADSLDIVESVMALEESFDVELPDEETTALKNVGDVADLIETKL
uniref:Acyl carrier protein n=1 Tax=Alexandrium monilatum TaxID=311494 RepID=A0A6T1L454_9DINO|eukprot:CAMPEP_0175253894 /NCGR_PEP_ID=MMETSP0093-20121207/36917_1 /TAXON_ID=311494 /ORGANISM="Alexandrium monilatum, Strain CCMP3105" /LENGTH=140 /DNA_ID=CAMNT_0016548211 /DNA_START=42 /DNA_END=464 /DNA_ORIENTATION=-